ncbi:hypothetical protein ACIA5D_45260 [Actinoplanes sp. NPDC051513]|uniref:hypothetical protein n=1 Tax=Actinoplanes sp. NPDC051513 TaxID=3363908 RepID=UPI0037AFEEA2
MTSPMPLRSYTRPPTWMREALLHYQRHDFADIAEAIAASLGWSDVWCRWPPRWRDTRSCDCRPTTADRVPSGDRVKAVQPAFNAPDH